MSSANYHIVVTEPYAEWAIARLREVGRVTLLTTLDELPLQEAIQDADALLVRTYTQVTRSLLETAPKLRVIGRGGVGVENIDLEAAAAKGIVVVSTPDASTDAVADLTLGLLISLVRGIKNGDNAVRAGRFFEARGVVAEQEMQELTIGIIGMGRVGQAVGRRCRNGFGMTVLYNDVISPGWIDFAAVSVSKDELYRRSDVVSVHAPLNSETRGMIDKKALARLKTGGFLINTSRGAVVDNLALADCLKDGHLAGAALDVTEPEPLPLDHPLLAAPNLLITPHIGAKTASAYRRMNEVVTDVIRVLHGGKPINPVQYGCT